jgi:hypothetical protein
MASKAKKSTKRPVKTARFHFRIPIGDWSGDGHGHCEWYDATSAKPVEELREAYFQARAQFPEVCPENFCNQYEDSTIPNEVMAELVRLGAPLPERDDDDEDVDDDGEYIIDGDVMAALVVWFLNLGDSTADVKLDPKASTPMLPFYGFDEQRRHIGFFGYGLFWG